MLGFARQQIEEMERDIGSMREARSSFGRDEVMRIMQRFGDLSRKQSSDAREAARNVIRMASKDAQGGPELREKVDRASRRRCDLQARQLLLASQQQAERERFYKRPELEVERDEYTKLRAQRMRAAEDKVNALQEALTLADELGVGPTVAGELFKGSRSLSGAAALPPPAQRREGARSSHSTPSIGPSLGQVQRSAPAAAVVAAATFQEAEAQAAEPGEVATWWRSMLTRSSSPDEAAASRRRVTHDHPPPHWAHFGGGGGGPTASSNWEGTSAPVSPGGEGEADPTAFARPPPGTAGGIHVNPMA